jgi:hypothetical protein
MGRQAKSVGAENRVGDEVELVAYLEVDERLLEIVCAKGGERVGDLSGRGQVGYERV